MRDERMTLAGYRTVAPIYKALVTGLVPTLVYVWRISF